MFFDDILDKNDYLPSIDAVNLIVNLDIFQNGYDVTENLSEHVERSTRKLKEKLIREWHQLLEVETPDGKSRITLLQYLGALDYAQENGEYFNITVVSFRELVRRYNTYMESNGCPTISLDKPNIITEPASGDEAKMLTDFAIAITDFVKNIMGREKVTKNQFKSIFVDCINKVRQYKAIMDSSEEILSALNTGLKNCKVKGRPETAVRDKMIQVAFYLASKYPNEAELPSGNLLKAKDKPDIKLRKDDINQVVEAFIKYRCGQ